jgi:hypothetical protein
MDWNISITAPLLLAIIPPIAVLLALLVQYYAIARRFDASLEKNQALEAVREESATALDTYRQHQDAPHDPRTCESCQVLLDAVAQKLREDVNFYRRKKNARVGG